MSNEAPIPRTLEPPPRSTGDIQRDYPLIIDYIYRAYQIIGQSVSFINAQLTTSNLDVTQLPDPATATVYSAQNTANAAYALATADGNEILALQHKAGVKGIFAISDANTSGTVMFTTAQDDTDYTVMIQPVSSTGTPADGAYTITSKTYAVGQFDATILAAPGAGNSVTYEWQLIRNS